MKKTLLNTLLLLMVNTLMAQSPVGAWESTSIAENGDTLRSVLILTDGYQILTVYNQNTGEFIETNGGSWKLEGNTMTEGVEFHTSNSAAIGTEVSFEIALTDSTIQIVGTDQILTRIDDGKPGALQGAWLMSGRVRNGETSMRDTSGPRKTMKILSGTRFQWIAYNIETKQFMGSGGGTYTTENGEYVENIEFFSRDASRAGASLKFDYELIDGNWHHKGFSSKGDPLHEIWSRRD